MTVGPTSPPDAEIEAIRRQVAEQQSISQQLTRYVADLHKLLSERDIARSAALRASRTRDDRLAQLSVDLRQPLGTIIGFAQVLLQEQRSDRDRDALVRILDAGLEMDRLADAMLHQVRDPLDDATSVAAATFGSVYELVGRAVLRLGKASGVVVDVRPCPEGAVSCKVRLDAQRLKVALDHILLGLADRGGILMQDARISDTLDLVIVELTLDGALESAFPANYPLSAALLRSIGMALEIASSPTRHSIMLHMPTLPVRA